MNGNDFEQMYSKYEDKLTKKNKIARLVWNVAWGLLFRPFDLPVFNKWRTLVLRMFGANIGKGSIIHASAKVWAPWNLEIGYRTAIGSHAYLYNPDLIKIGSKCVVSQYAYLCTASHDITDEKNPLITAPIIIEDKAWVAADAFVGMGVTVHERAVVGARACVFKDVEAWTVVGGNPAKVIKQRVLQ